MTADKSGTQMGSRRSVGSVEAGSGDWRIPQEADHLRQQRKSKGQTALKNGRGFSHQNKWLPAWIRTTIGTTHAECASCRVLNGLKCP
jgi:hypothetical protein